MDIRWDLLILGFIPLVLAITLHEAAHAFVAKKFGDLTSYNLGRVSLNPLKHIDLIGTILIPSIALITTGFIFGWAKPVPVKFGNLKNPKRHSVYVAAAGPLANLAMALIYVILLIIINNLSSYPIPNLFTSLLLLMFQIGISINISFMILNLLPILPLDGGRIVAGLLPNKLAYEFSKMEPYGMWIVIALVFSGFLTPILQGANEYAMRVITWLIIFF